MDYLIDRKGYAEGFLTLYFNYGYLITPIGKQDRNETSFENTLGKMWLKCFKAIECE